ncbi:MAG TPA: CvpA family protein [Candidatus Saccharimonas sp.]|nr:CvpA family protein [Candidatus Saccharimonas sp.]
MIVDLLIVAAIGGALYLGGRRGFLVVAIELTCFLLATTLALAGYQPFGRWLRDAAEVTTALANVVAFLLIWVVTEVAAGLVVRFRVLPRLPRHVNEAPLSRLAGALLNGVKAAVLLALALVIFAGLPLSAATKQPVTDAALSRILLGSSSHLQRWLATGLGRDINESLDFFTVPSEPQDTRRIELGFSTTDVRVDPAAETAMVQLVNQERTSRGLGPLTLNLKSQAVARAYATRMLADGIFSHYDNDGHDPFYRLRAGGVTFAAAGENLALAPTLQLAHQGLMNSPGHRANILSPVYRTIGIGIIDAGPHGLMVAQEFTD